MKKFYAICAAALMAAAPLSARELVFYVGEEAVEPGTTVTVSDFNFVPGTPMQAMDPDLYLYSDIIVTNVTITADCTSGQTIQLCAGGDCVANVKIVKEGISIGTGVKLPMKYEYMEMNPGATAFPRVVTDFTAVDEDHPDVKASFTLVMDTSLGVATIVGNENSFRAVNGGIAYSFDVPTAVELHTLAGEKALGAVLEGAGTLSTSDLEPGIYVYNAGGKTGKIYIR